MPEEKAQWTKTEEEKLDLWSKKDLIESALEFVYIEVRSKKLVCKRINKEEEIDIQKRTITFSPTTGTLTDVDAQAYQLEVLKRALVKPKLTAEELLQMDASLFNEIFVAYQSEIGLGLETQENL